MKFLQHIHNKMIFNLTFLFEHSKQELQEANYKWRFAC